MWNPLGSRVAGAFALFVVALLVLLVFELQLLLIGRRRSA